MNTFRKVSLLSLLAMLVLCLQYCTKKTASEKTYDASIATSVEVDYLTASIERRLAALEKVEIQPRQISRPIRVDSAASKLIIISAFDAVRGID